MNELVVQAQSISKAYKLYKKPVDRLKESMSLTKKVYHQDFFALRDVSFKIYKGETIGIIGQNGSGKSTLLKILTGVLSPSSGNINIQGKISALLELGAGFNPEYTGLENIYLNGTIMGYTKEEMSKRVDEILRFADIGEFIYQPVKNYSSGMFVRLAFAVAINVDPDILIVDEALSVGDVFFQLKCFKKFNDFKNQGKTIILVTHDLGSVVKYCTRAIMLQNGQIVAEGSTKEVIDKYKKSMVGINISSNDSEKSSIARKDGRTKLLSKNFQRNPNTLEYGNKKAQIIDYAILDENGVPTTSISKNKDCTFFMKIKFNEDVKDPIYAFAIKDVKGYEITGTNTMQEMIDTGFCKAGDVVEVSFTQKMILQGGPYFLSFGCTHFNLDGKLEVFHRLYDILNIEIMASKISCGLFDMESNLKITKL